LWQRCVILDILEWNNTWDLVILIYLKICNKCSSLDIPSKSCQLNHSNQDNKGLSRLVNSKPNKRSNRESNMANNKEISRANS
jgi:hypothetical protein